jgi:hypothetical protein
MKETYNANAGSVKVLFQATEGYVLASRSGGGRPMFSKEVRQAVLDGKQDAGPVVCRRSLIPRLVHLHRAHRVIEKKWQSRTALLGGWLARGIELTGLAMGRIY